MQYFSMLIPLIAALLASSPAVGQQVLFDDDFANGVGAWNAEAPWHWAPANDHCTSLSNAPASHGAMVRVGDPDCTYNSIYQNQFYAARLQVTQAVLIPIDAVNPRLEFDSYLDADPYAWGQVFLSGSSGWQFVGGPGTSMGSWDGVGLALCHWRGIHVRWVIEFIAPSGIIFNHLGWLIDNVRILADGTAQSYCVAAANSVSLTGATIGYAGSLDLSRNNFEMTLHDGPPGQFGLFFYGPFQAQTPVAQGFLCIGPDAFGFRRLLPAVQIDGNGNASHLVNFPALTGSHTVMPDVRVNFQCWYRDMVGGLSVSNFSDALSITFSP